MRRSGEGTGRAHPPRAVTPGSEAVRWHLPNSPGRERTRAGRPIPIRWLLASALVLSAGTACVVQIAPIASASGSGSNLAPTFTLTDIYGHSFSLSSYRTQSVVLIEFTSLTCSECQIVEKSLKTLDSSYNRTGHTNVQMISIYIGLPPLGSDTVPALQTYHTQNNITWTMARDTQSLAVSQSYGVTAIPDVVLVDKTGHVVYDVSGVQDTGKIQSTITAALAGTAPAITIVTVSVFALAAIAGVTTFFSPCAFPMFPGYMSLFLGLNAGRNEANPAGPGARAYRGAARRAVVAGSVTALGMVLVFLVVGLLLIFAASTVSKYIPYLMIVVGAILVGLGALLVTNLQYWRIVTPLQNLWRKLRGTPASASAESVLPASGEGLYVKLFGYGVGYAAAAAGCVAPVIFSAIIAGLALSLLGGILNILIFTVTAAVLMIAVTVLLAMAGQKFVNKLKAFTPVIKKISAGVLIVVGFYLIYFYYTAWGF